MAVYAQDVGGQRRKRRLRMAGRQSQPEQYGAGFVVPTGTETTAKAPQYTGARIQSMYRQPERLSALTSDELAGGRLLPPAALSGKGYGQEQGLGQGYITPRRSLGDQHQNVNNRIASYGRGYSPVAAGAMFGGRPRGRQPRKPNQMQAMTRYAFPARSYIERPFGGRGAVPRSTTPRWNILGGG